MILEGAFTSMEIESFARLILNMQPRPWPGFGPQFRSAGFNNGAWCPRRFLLPNRGRLRRSNMSVFSFPPIHGSATPGQWTEAASLTLDLCEEAIDGGFILKDATLLNILFSGPSPIFVDVLSFESRDLESPLWIAYGQFIRTFLLPLCAFAELGWPLAATMQWRDGYKPADVAPWKLNQANDWEPAVQVRYTSPC